MCWRRDALGALGCTALMAACGQASPRRLSVEQDTLVLYGYETVPPPVRGLVRSGEITLTRRNQLSLSADTAVENRYGRVQCRKTGSASAVVRVDDERVQFTVICRPAVRVQMPKARWMESGAPAQSLAVDATLESGEQVRLQPLSMTVSREGVVRSVNGEVAPVAAGLVNVYADYGGLTLRHVIAVRDLVAHDTLRLRSGEFRTWTLSRGRYEFTVKPVRAGDPLQWFDLVAEGTQCTRLDRAPETVYCVVYDHANLGVRNVATAPPDVERQAFVQVLRTP